MANVVRPTLPYRVGTVVKRLAGPSAEHSMLADSALEVVAYGHMEIEFTQHARDVIAERRLDFDWIARTMKAPQLVQDAADGTRHFLARVPEQEGRVLRVVVNSQADLPIVVTAFLDRRMRGRLP
jgi:hypothetical protein